MAVLKRRSVPDNLDPLVDTLANVVGILIIVIVLTQLELGDALLRVSEGASGISRAAQEVTETSEPLRDDLPSAAEHGARRLLLEMRTDADPSTSIQQAQEILAALDQLDLRSASPSPEAGAHPGDEELEDAIRTLQAEALEARALVEADKDLATSLRRVPKNLVARLPDPRVERGYESWILVRQQSRFSGGSRSAL